jgi:nitrite reductase/ring-hydroxylating ferredoxin subunit
MEKYKVASKREIQEGSCKIVSVRGVEYGLFKVNGQFYAWRNACPHFGAPVCEGKICGTRLPSAVYEYKLGRENEILRCPWHGWEFDLITGEHLVDPATKLRQGRLKPPEGEERLDPGHLEEDDDSLYLWL